MCGVADHDMVIVGVVGPGVCGRVPGSVLLYGGGGGKLGGLRGLGRTSYQALIKF